MSHPRSSPTLVRLLAAVLLASGLAGLALLAWRHPDALGFIPPCPWHAVTGLRCPGCGMTRAVHFALRGDLLAALRLNPAVALVPLLGAAALWYLGFALARGRWVRLPRPPPWSGWLLLTTVMLSWLLRTVIDLLARRGG